MRHSAYPILLTIRTKTYRCYKKDPYFFYIKKTTKGANQSHFSQHLRGLAPTGTAIIQALTTTHQLQPRNDAVAMENMFAWQTTNGLVQLKVFHADVALKA